jgi:hypothetical protein
MSKFFHNNLYMPTLHGNIGIGTAAPDSLLHVAGSFKATGAVELDGGAVTINEAGADVDFRVEGDTVTHLLFVDASAESVSVGGTSLATSLLGVSATGVVVNEVSNATTDFRAETGTVTHAIFSDASANTVSFGGTGITDAWLQAAATGVIVNEAGADADFRVEGDTVTHLLFVDAGAEEVSMGGTTSATSFFSASGTEVCVNEVGADTDFRVEGDTQVNLLVCDASVDAVGVGTATPTESTLDVRSADASGKACVKMQQLDVDQAFLLFDANAAATGDLLSAISTHNTASITEHVRVAIDVGAGPVTRWIGVSTTPTA